MNDTPQSISVAQFCAANDLSRATFYNLVRDGKAPRTMKIGRRTLIPCDEALAWQRRMLAATAKAA